MGYVTDKKYTGGSNGSRGNSFQDKIAIKYIFDYLDKGLKEVSLETADDFCIVFDSGEKMYCQVKINQFTPGFIKNLINNKDLPECTFFIGSGYNDDFRNLVQYKERYLNLKKGLLVGDKDALYEDIQNCCKKEGLDVDAFLACGFDEVNSTNSDMVAKAFIEQWARNKMKYIDIDGLYDEILALCDKKRAVGGALLKEDIESLIQSHVTSKITSFVPKQDRVSSVIEKQCIIEIEKLFDTVICDNPKLEKDLKLIKTEVLNEQFVEAKNHLEEILTYVPMLESLYFMILNTLGLHDEVISAINLENEEPDCLFECAKAYYLKRDFYNSQKCIDLIDREFLDTNVLCISGTNNRMLGNIDKAIQDLELAIKYNNKNIDAYIQLAEILLNIDMKRAVDYCDEALKIDPKYPNVYMVRAKICKLSNDYKAVVDNLKKYLMLSNDENNDEILLDIAIYNYLVEPYESQFSFFQWNQAYRCNNGIIETDIVEYPCSFGKIGGCRFKLISKKDKIIVRVNDEFSFLLRTTEGYSRTAVGIYVDPVNFQLHEFVSRGSDNPLESSFDALCKKASIPALFKIYEDEDTFRGAYEKLIKNSAVHLNHEYDDFKEEYIVDKEAVDIKITLFGKHLTGSAKIGDQTFNLDINPLMNDAIDQFRYKLEKDENTMEAALILKYGADYLIQFSFSKDVINIQSE